MHRHTISLAPVHRPYTASRRGPIAAAACAVVALASWQSVTAAPVLTAFIGRPVGSSGCLALETQRAIVGPLTAEQSCATGREVGNPTAHGYAYADYGRLGTAVSLTLENAGLLSGSNSGGARSSFTGDYQVSGPGLPGSRVDVQLNLLLHGALALFADAASRDDSASVTVSLSGSFGPARTASLKIHTDRATQFTNTLDGDADFTTLLLPGGGEVDIDTDSFSVPVETPFTLSLSLESTAGVSTLGFGPVESAHSLFGSTLGFVAGADVFTLPAGYTVNGTAVVDNRWTGATGVVPEPGTGAMALAGLAWLALLTRRRLGVGSPSGLPLASEIARSGVGYA